MNKVNDAVLAIGDGSNDVPMIRTANVGLGIQGLEGAEAATNADYSITQFKDMRRLLFFHGMKISEKFNLMVNFFLFKAVIQTSTQFYFAFTNGFSG